jgi:hypothetical protein
MLGADYEAPSFLDFPTPQEQVHDVVVFRFVIALQPPGEMDQMNFDPLHNRILLQHAARAIS